ncbi:MAG TPA: hypothetical protein VNV65_03800 [Candidatus Solibacter sp.]|nr:hypothetical protein [Candidatus Solibacter sp.]
MTRPTGSSGSWTNHGFGLGLRSAFPLAGCAPGSTDGRPPVRLELASRSELTAAFARKGTSVMAHRPGPSGRPLARLLAHPRSGYLISSPGHGLFQVSSRGDLVRCAPNAVAAWLWQRSLLGEVLPLVSALRGMEALHASAVVLGAGLPAIAVAGASGSGKSSLAVELILRGGALLADDVTVVENRRAEVVAHPALGLLSLNPVTAARLEHRFLDGGVGSRVGSSHHTIRLAVQREERPVRLGAIYFLQPGHQASVRLTEVRPADPRLLLGSTFNVALRTPRRLIAQLDACAAMAVSVRMVRVSLPAAVDFSIVAGRLLTDAQAAGLLARPG